MSNHKTSEHYGHALSHIHDTGFAGVAEAAADMLICALKASRLTHGRITDLGCGSGILARRLFDQGYTVEGVDQSVAMLALAQSRAPRGQNSDTSHCSTVRSGPQSLSVPLVNVLTTSSTATMMTRRWTAYCTACISHWKAVGFFSSTSLRRTGS